MSYFHRIGRPGAAGLMGMLLLTGAAQAALDSSSTGDTSPSAGAAAGADRDKSSKTIELLLQMQDGASAPSTGRSTELPTIRMNARGGGTGRAGTDGDAQAPTLADGPVGEPQAAGAVRTEGTESTGIVRRVESPLVQNLPTGDSEAIVQPSKALRFFRENRAMAIGAALALLVIVAVIGARGGRKG